MALSTTINQMSVKDNATFALSPPLSVNNYVLTANVAVNITIANITDANGIKPSALLFSCTGNFYVLWNGTGATVPAVSITTGAGLELNPAVRHIGAVTTQFSVVAPVDCVLTLAIYSTFN